MAQIIRQSTAITVAIGPFLDSTDGVTAETGLTITQPDIRLSKNGAAFAQKSAAQTLSHMENGYYSLSLSTTDTDAVGRLTLHVAESGALPVFYEFQVVEEVVYDALFVAAATGALPVAAGGIVAASFGAGAIDAAAIAANAIGSSEIADGAITAAKLASDAIADTKIASGAITSAKIAADAIGASQIATNAITAGKVATDAVGAAQLATDAVTEISAAVLAALKGQDRRGTAQGAGSGSNTLVLAAGDSAVDDFYNGGLVVVLEGAGTAVPVAERTRRITDYVNSTNQITVDANWADAVDNTTVYLIVGG